MGGAISIIFIETRNKFLFLFFVPLSRNVYHEYKLAFEGLQTARFAKEQNSASGQMF